MLFTGTKEYNVDEKGRVVLPTRYREVLSGDIMIFKDIQSNCINVYPYKEYEKYISTIYDENDMIDRETKLLINRVISRAEAVQLDKQGRIMIPQKMRDSIGIEKDVFVSGAIKSIEIWTPQAYELEYGDDDEAVKAYVNKLKAKRELKMKGLS